MTDPSDAVPKAVGMSWYAEHEYPRVRQAMIDGHVLPTDYHRWLQLAEQNVRRIEQQGMRVIRAQMNLDHFIAWCAGLNIQPDANARMRWANEAAYRALMQERPQ